MSHNIIPHAISVLFYKLFCSARKFMWHLFVHVLCLLLDVISFIFFFYFSLQLLNKRIENFINSYKNISYPDAKPYVDDELMKLQKRWDDFKSQSLKLKNKLSSAQQYFSLLENVSCRQQIR